MKYLATLLLLCSISIGFAQKTDGPYLSVSTKDAVIPLKSSFTEVEISGTIAHVKLTQVYQNKGNLPLEATYVFPLSTQAAVHNMQMKIGDRIIKAKIFEKQEAKKVYETAVKEGKRAAKLDQNRPNVFQMNVGNIMADDEITITIFYTELLVPTHGSYQFVAPAVVGPRFIGESAQKEEAFNMPYMPKGSADSFKYDLKVSLNAGMIIQNINSPSHQINVKYPNPKTANIFLSKSNVNPGNRDFILDYNLRGNKIQSGLLLYEHEGENFFALQMEPTKNINYKDIPAREYLFIVDVSGSMNGYPLEVSKELMRNLLCDLRATDTFNVQLFASSSTIFSPNAVESNEQNIEAAIRFLSEGQGGGGTELLSALKEAYKLPRKDPNSARSMVVVTDGYVNIEKEAFQLINSNLDQANVFTFGIGSSVNRYLIEGMAKVSQSESFIATSPAEAVEVAKAFKNYIETPLLTQVKLKTKGFEIYDMAPSSIPDVFAARPVLVYGKYHGKPEGTILITGYQGKKKFKQEFKVSASNLSDKNKALPYLWARKKIEELDDYNVLFYNDVKDEVIALGLKYNLLSKYTSFVAVDETIVNKDGVIKSVKQPLPMPENVNNAAVGAEAEFFKKAAYKKSYTTTITEKLVSTDKRKIKMEFNAQYATLVTKHLQHYKSLRIKFNAEGQITSLETLENGQWVYAQDLLIEFHRIPTKAFSVNSAITLTLNR
ncbi:VIT and vWA domain-containing protein [Bizionia arctica]|uniref:Inter-alpha-trypsin inhibitor domain-containing protein n=1 Tax=Bizionia arctica TaxID=1495645 RepID=A0A917LNZ3_9FLAO|nr:VIT and VWA domain-containing protein [Bizionia arctica]GGG47027.1 inter-alpha-trypsin inhibitor domain-containing protein [Bizionia arctica]